MAVRAETGGQFTDFPDGSGDFCLIGVGRIKLVQGPEIRSSEFITKIIFTDRKQILGSSDGELSYLEHIDGPTSQYGWMITLKESWETVKLRAVRSFDQEEIEITVRHREILPTVTIEQKRN
jgi:hypothetical protein